MSKLNKAVIAAGAAAGVYTALRAAKRNRRALVAPGRCIVVLGSGFGGMCAVQRLAALLPRETEGLITLIDERNYLLFTPMLPEVASCELDPLDIVRSPKLLSGRVRFLQAAIEDIDLGSKKITVNIGGEIRIMDADFIVIALGSITNFHHIPGVADYAFTMKSLEDAQRLRNRAIEMLERANAHTDSAVRRRLLTFVVAGGGFTGVETAAAMNDLIRDSIRLYPQIREDEVSMCLVEPGRRILPELEPDLAAYAQRQLEDRGIEVMLLTKLVGAGEDWVELQGGQRIAAHTLVWAAGVKPSPVVERLNVERGPHGGIVVDEYCAVPGHPGVWAVGDCAEVPLPDGSGTYGPTAQNATREGERAAENVVAVMRGEPQRPFRHRTIGEMALVGKHAGVASIYGVHVCGLPAWVLWRMVYLSKTPGWAQRTRVLLDWVLDYAFGRNIAAAPAGAPPQNPAIRTAEQPVQAG